MDQAFALHTVNSGLISSIHCPSRLPEGISGLPPECLHLWPPKKNYSAPQQNTEQKPRGGDSLACEQSCFTSGTDMVPPSPYTARMTSAQSQGLRPLGMAPNQEGIKSNKKELYTASGRKHYGKVQRILQGVPLAQSPPGLIVYAVSSGPQGLPVEFSPRCF